MRQVQNFNAYPLTASLSKRVLSYLSFFRLFISMALAFAYATDGLV